jgi:phage tail sheath protein FI
LLYFRDGIPIPFVDPLDPANQASPQRREPDVLEDFDNLSADSTSANYVETVINAASTLVEARFVNALGSCHAPASGRPLDMALHPGGTCGDTGSALAGGTQGAAVTPAEFAGDPTLPAEQRTGLAAIASINEVSLLLAPDEVNDDIANSAAITDALVEQCESLRDRFALLSIRQGQSDVQTIAPPRNSSYGAVYYPWVRVFDARMQSTLLMPAVGHVAGIYARSDMERGVHKAPANEIVRGLVDQDPSPGQEPLEYVITTRELDILNPRGVNTIRDFRAGHHGIRVWGARTMSSDPEWKYVNVRRLFLFVEQSIDRGTQWVVFEPNGELLWAVVRQAVSNFLLSVWRSGALQGSTPDKAFFVRCDRTTMTQNDIDNGRLICLVGIAPLRPAEFVIFRIGQWTQEHQS